MDRVARRGPIARAPGALKGGHFAVKGGTLWKKKTKQCRKTGRGKPLGFLNTQSVVKQQRN